MPCKIIPGSKKIMNNFNINTKVNPKGLKKDEPAYRQAGMM